MQALRSFLFVVLFVEAASAQQLWKVHCQGGPGIHFTDLPPAVAAAAPGDTIWVFATSAGCPGGGAGYTACTLDKPLHILGFAVPTPPFPPGSPPSSIGLNGTLSIVGIPSGQRVVVSNIGVGASPPATTGLRILSCAGEVIVDGFGHSSSGQGNHVFEITNSANVTLRRFGVQYSGSSLTILDSNVLLSGAGMFGIPPNSSTVPITPAISLVNSTLTITRSAIHGAWGTPFFQQSQPAIVMTNSTLYAGPATNAYGGNWYGYFPPVYNFGVFSTGSVPSTVYLDPRTIMTGTGGNTNVIPQDIDAIAIDYAVANDWMRTYVAGPSDGFALLAVGDLAPAPITTPFGSLLVDPLTMAFVDLVHLPASVSGYVIKDYFVPASAQNAHAYALQALTLSPQGALGLTLPTPFCVGWEHGRIP